MDHESPVSVCTVCEASEYLNLSISLPFARSLYKSPTKPKVTDTFHFIWKPPGNDLFYEYQSNFI